MSNSTDLNLTKMNWLNKPKEWSVNQRSLTIFTDSKSDFWQKTHYGYSFDNGSFYYTNCKGEFEAIVKITGEYNTQYDQLGIMIRIDEKIWIKAGIEYVDNQMNISAVVTHENSDWSIIKLDQMPKSIWIKLKRKSDAVEIYYSLDNKNFTMMRLAYFPEIKTCMVGLMAASPKGKGFNALFEDFEINDL